ncbi:MAG: hypothetical protein JWN50_396 [Parcubacteria group bacterium]|nr:hypothetical protein [Parcubacteria group bacterium]
MNRHFCCFLLVAVTNYCLNQVILIDPTRKLLVEKEYRNIGSTEAIEIHIGASVHVFKYRNLLRSELLNEGCGGVGITDAAEPNHLSKNPGHRWHRVFRIHCIGIDVV